MQQSDHINVLRFLSADAVQKANSGHPGMPMGMAEIATALWSKHLRQIQKIQLGSIEIDLYFQMGMAQCFYTAYCT